MNNSKFIEGAYESRKQVNLLLAWKYLLSPNLFQSSVASNYLQIILFAPGRTTANKNHISTPVSAILPW
jgi:hypothetical protein